ncbi:hypothetical protein F5Y13DRAFT_167924 [Hypoxylon sp. FL1857]|nr:hypothetical protein F5Y13DRAFT_167924 [Hypoxylon sp. FL1857]
MDTLEIFEKARALPKDQIPVIPLKPVVLPIVIGKGLGQPWPPPHRAAAYFLDDDTAIKLPTQQYIPDIAPGGPEKLLLTLSLGNFIFRDLERDNLDLINSQSSLSLNLVRELRVGERNITFFERLTPLTAIWDSATEQQRKRWARELVSAVAFLESLGFVPNKTEVRDIGIDRTGRLKLVGYGTSPRLPSARDIADFEKAESEADYDGRLGLHPIEKFRRGVESAYQRVASCLHYILTGVDPDENMRSMTKEQLTELRILARKGEYPVAPGATAIADILQDEICASSRVLHFGVMGRSTIGISRSTKQIVLLLRRVVCSNPWNGRR